MIFIYIYAEIVRVRPGALRAASFTGPKQDRRTSFLLQEAHPEDTGPAPDPVRAVEKAPSSDSKTDLRSREVLAPLSPLVRRPPHGPGRVRGRRPEAGPRPSEAKNGSLRAGAELGTCRPDGPCLGGPPAPEVDSVEMISTLSRLSGRRREPVSTASRSSRQRREHLGAIDIGRPAPSGAH